MRISRPAKPLRSKAPLGQCTVTKPPRCCEMFPSKTAAGVEDFITPCDQPPITPSSALSQPSTAAGFLKSITILVEPGAGDEVGAVAGIVAATGADGGSLATWGPHPARAARM